MVSWAWVQAVDTQTHVILVSYTESAMPGWSVVHILRLKRKTLLVTERADVKRLAVESIIIPIEGNVPQKPSVGPEDRIVDTIEVMLKNDLKRIAVTEGDRVVGMIRLEDALEQVGLKRDLKSKGKRSIVVHGRKIILDE